MTITENQKKSLRKVFKATLKQSCDHEDNLIEIMRVLVEELCKQFPEDHVDSLICFAEESLNAVKL